MSQAPSPHRFVPLSSTQYEFPVPRPTVGELAPAALTSTGVPLGVCTYRVVPLSPVPDVIALASAIFVSHTPPFDVTASSRYPNSTLLMSGVLSPREL